MTATRFVLLLALALTLAGCQGAPSWLSIVLDKQEHRKPDPNDSYDPYGLVGSTTRTDNGGNDE
jgi:hypothetical protein